MQSSPPSGSKPPHRIVVKPLGRQLTITTSINGRQRTLFDTIDALQLAESNYPVRFYFPRDALSWSFELKPSDHKDTYCPFKGFAQYHDVAEAGSRIPHLKAAVWSYSTPFPSSDAYDIRGHFCVAAPDHQFQLKIDGRILTQDQAQIINQQLLAASPSNVSSPSLLRDVLEQERKSRSTNLSTSATLQPPPMKRSASNGSNATPPSFPIARPLGGELEIDSTNPVLADMIYRYDDEAHEDERHPHLQHDAEAGGHAHRHGSEGSQADRPATVDDHLLWFKDQPWYRKPSEKWLRPFALLISMAGGMCMGPKLELLNMFVCEDVLGDSYVGGSDIIVPQPPPNSSLLHVDHTQTFTLAGLHLETFQPWSAPLSGLGSSDPEVVTAYFAALEQPNSTVIPVPRRPSKACFASPEVQSSLATLQLRMTLSMGILAALTTGFWSNLSSRRGRLPVLRISMAGIVFTDLVILTAALVPRSKLPFGYSFLVLGTTIEGLLGGYSAAIAVHQSYISDVTPSGTRAHIFAHFMGIVYAGLALGPTLGGLVVKHTDNILAPFWFALAMHLIYLVGVFSFIPESTSKEFRVKALREYKESRAEIKRKANERKTAELQPLLGSRGQQGDARPFKRRVWKRVKVMFMDSVLYAPLEPLSFLLPKKVVEGEDEEAGQRRGSHAGTPRLGAQVAPEASASHISVSRVAPKTRYDYNLSFLSLTYFTETAIIGIMSFKMQYAQKQFIWGSAELGMYLTFLSVTRVLALTFILPLAIKFLHRPVKALRLPQDGPPVEEEQTVAPNSRRHSTLDDEGRPHRRVSSYGALDQSCSATAQSSEEEDHVDDDGVWDENKKNVEELWTLRAKHLRLIHDSKFDLKLAKISVFVNTISYALLIFSNTPQLFFLATAITSLGGGGGAAMSSLALALLKSPADAGKLFGAWSITSAISGTVVGPILFAEVFKKTTKTFPPAIFVVGTGMFVIAFLLLCGVKVRKPISLPSLPARPHLKPGLEENGDVEVEGTIVTIERSAYRSSTFKNAFSLKTAKGKDESKVNSRPGLPAFLN
ncbi:uncharacterized protein MEPE_01632 [Melanopsichium pennsylvanicum]|uniref:DUF427 domain-containing protein n=2 Tax=Melanopsichium pennsylvanicum TaxID=63383 RepID=A0AAJ4XJ54_9BASI|nr:mfs general substrate transporter [Melanopsichium pennsylvanicum 4]SNX82926.1 uncharacterized protein MEPE_01632 [Melanopsichium pennsylvanicum]